MTCGTPITLAMMQCADCVDETMSDPTACFDCIQGVLGSLLTSCCPCLYYAAVKMGVAAQDLEVDC